MLLIFIFCVHFYWLCGLDKLPNLSEPQCFSLMSPLEGSWCGLRDGVYYTGASLIVQLVKNSPAMQETQFDSWIWDIRWRRDRLPTSVFLPE